MADLEERISSLEQEIQASAHDFVKLNQLMAEKEEAGSRFRGEDGAVDVSGRAGCKDCRAVEYEFSERRYIDETGLYCGGRQKPDLSAWCGGEWGWL